MPKRILDSDNEGKRYQFLSAAGSCMSAYAKQTWQKKTKSPGEWGFFIYELKHIEAGKEKKQNTPIKSWCFF